LWIKKAKLLICYSFDIFLDWVYCNPVSLSITDYNSVLFSIIKHRFIPELKLKKCFSQSTATITVCWVCCRLSSRSSRTVTREPRSCRPWMTFSCCWMTTSSRHRPWGDPPLSSPSRTRSSKLGVYTYTINLYSLRRAVDYFLKFCLQSEMELFFNEQLNVIKIKVRINCFRSTLTKWYTMYW